MNKKTTDLKTLENKLNNIAKSLNKRDSQKVLSAFDFAQKAHAGQLRKSGEIFITHPLSVSLNLWEKYKDINLLVAGLLHDTVEDNEKIKAETIYKKFGNEIGFIVDTMNKREQGFYGKKIKFTDRTERLIWAGMQDVRVLILKIEDRQHNLETLNNLPDNKQVRMTFETQAIYYPLQNILNQKSVEKAQDNFLDFLKKKKLKTPDKIKEYMLNIFFKDFSRELYGLVYENTSKIIWEVNNLDWFESMAKNKKLGSHIEIESMCIDQDGFFQALFLFKKGHFFSAPGQLKALSIKE
jgi:(p)ppGpp synthase/HD superfamily hydrolase